MKAKEFECKGIMATLAQHCEREGLLVNGFYKFRAEKGISHLSHAEVFARFIACRRHERVTFRGSTKYAYEHLRDLGICPSNFSQFKRDCGLTSISTLEALEVFVERRERISARKAELRRMRESGMTNTQIYPRATKRRMAQNRGFGDET